MNLLPSLGAGDELQGIKKGVLELAVAVAVNKADGDNVHKANLARQEYENALHYLNPASLHWNPPVLTCSALAMAGIDEVWNTVLAHREKLTVAGELETKRKRQALDWMWALVEEGLKQRFNHNEKIKDRLPKMTGAVEKGNMAPTAAAMELLSLFDQNASDHGAVK